jgi:hypothetical protein
VYWVLNLWISSLTDVIYFGVNDVQYCCLGTFESKYKYYTDHTFHSFITSASIFLFSSPWSMQPYTRYKTSYLVPLGLLHAAKYRNCGPAWRIAGLDGDEVLVIFVLSPWSEEAIFRGAESNGHMETQCLKEGERNGRKGKTFPVQQMSKSSVERRRATASALITGRKRLTKRWLNYWGIAPAYGEPNTFLTFLAHLKIKLSP